MKTHKLKVTLNEIKRMQELAGIQNLEESAYGNKRIDAIVNFKKSQLEFYDSEEHDLIDSFDFEPLSDGSIDTDERDILDLFKNDYSFHISIEGIDYEGREIRNSEIDDVIRNPEDLMDILHDAVLEYDSIMNMDAMSKLG